MAQRGKPRSFSSAEAIAKAYTDFCNDIKAKFDEGKPCQIPSKSNFAEWTGCDRRTVYLTMEKYYPAIKKQINDIMAETLVEGVSRGIWQPTIIIFALKNWCGWADKVETKSEISGTLEQRYDAMKKLMSDDG